MGYLERSKKRSPGAWQKNIEVETTENILAFSAVYACISLIANDISKLRLKLTEQVEGIWEEITEGSTAFLPVIRKPNRYQTRIQFVSQWIVSKLIHGNSYILKVRDNRSVVVALFVLDPRLVTPLVSDDGSVYYRLGRDPLSELTEDETIVPASEIIHDRMLCLWHPLVGVSPIYACAASATQGIRIQNNSARFFENMSRPSGILTAPSKISDEAAARLKAHWESNYTGLNIGRIAVLGDGLEYEAMTIPAQQAQLIEQLRFTVEDVARCFHVPLHMLQSGTSPTLASIGAINQAYYSQTLQSLIEDFELCLDEGLALPAAYDVEFDLDGLLRLDPLSRAETSQKAIGAGYMKPNEARLKENLPPVEGGDTPYLQQQNWSLAQLDKRDIVADKPAVAAPQEPAPIPDQAREFLSHFSKAIHV
jgi:HK97 family phage portal protein